MCVKSGQLPGEAGHHREDGRSAHARVAGPPGAGLVRDHPGHAHVRPELSHQRQKRKGQETHGVYFIIMYILIGLSIV